MPSAINYSYFEHPDSNYLLVLIHGLFGTLDNLSVVRRHFQDKVSILAVDLPDHGQSAHVERFSVADSAASLIPVIEQHRKRRVGLLGHSLGGKIAMRIALDNPARIDDLIVADVAPVNYPSRHDSIIRALKSVTLGTLTKRTDADDMLKQGIPEAGVRQFLLKSLDQNADRQWRWRFNLDGLSTNYSAIKGWQATQATFEKPALFIKGGKSDYITPDMQPDIIRYFPYAKAHIIEGAGHWLHAEKPEAFNRIVEKHIIRP